jgi:UDP-GlcNAc:undecaprenyl-phosphate/decaprenyl-phosphate GlcNAc-1-phosphate transferase
LDAVSAFVVAALVAAALTPAAAVFARRVGAVDQPGGRGLATRVTPRLGGLGILAGVIVSTLIYVDLTHEVRGILLGALVIAAVGALDDTFGLPPAAKFLGQVLAAFVAVASGVTVDNVVIPFVGPTDIGGVGGPLTLAGLVFLMNVVNFSDGVDGLAAGVCAISGVAFALIAFDLDRVQAGILAALIAGSAAGFLVHNFPPARIFMGDTGSNLLGFLLGCAAVQGTLKTNAVIALVAPLAIMAVAFLDTGFVVLKRLKYRRTPWSADMNHFHHRMARIGFSARRTLLYLYAWTVALSGLAVALRFLPYYHDGHYDAFWLVVMALIGVVVVGVSVYLLFVLEILKFRRRRARELVEADPDTSEWQIDRRVEEDLDTGEWETTGAR